MRKPSETDFVRLCRDYLRLRGLVVWRVNGGGAKIGNRFVRFTDTPGLPDLMCILPGGRLCCVEAKGPRGTLRESQKTFLAAAEAAGALVVVARGLGDVVEALEGKP